MTQAAAMTPAHALLQGFPQGHTPTPDEIRANAKRRFPLLQSADRERLVGKALRILDGDDESSTAPSPARETVFTVNTTSTRAPRKRQPTPSLAPKADRVVKGFPAGTAPTVEEVREHVKRRYPRMSRAEQRELVERAIDLIDAKPKEVVESFPWDSLEEASHTPAGRICVVPVEGTDRYARIIFDRIVRRDRLYMKVFDVAFTFAKLAR